jgi:hypothetical protein
VRAGVGGTSSNVQLEVEQSFNSAASSSQIHGKALYLASPA